LGCGDLHMIKHEGVRRLKLLGKLFLLIGCFGNAALYATSWFLLAEWSRQSSLPMFLFPWLSQFAMLGVVAWCGGWVLEGFVSRGE
jgi:lipopolysaccharide export LptBFGC system permease protein LptF